MTQEAAETATRMGEILAKSPNAGILLQTLDPYLRKTTVQASPSQIASSVGVIRDLWKKLPGETTAGIAAQREMMGVKESPDCPDDDGYYVSVEGWTWVKDQIRARASELLDQSQGAPI